MILRLSFAASCLLVATGCAADRPAVMRDARADSTAVHAALDDYITAALANDVAALKAAYTADVAYISQGMPTIRGRAAMESLVDELHATMDVTSLDVAVEELSVSGDAGWIIGTFRETLTASDGATQELTGRFVQLWLRQPDGSWKMARAFGTDLGE